MSRVGGMFLDVKQKQQFRSDRVKSVDLHTTEPWLLTSLYSGQLVLHDYQSRKVLKQWKVSELPVRSCAFIERKQWAICGCDDQHVRIYNYNTGEIVHSWEAHQDYIRCVTVHPTLPLILTCSDDMSLKLWDWDQNFSLKRTYDGHTHNVMSARFNPKDPNTFASASLDRTVKVWGLGSSTPHFSLDGKEGHENGVNAVTYYAGGERPYLVSGSDDRTVKVWDYVNKSCVQTLTAHTHNVSAVAFHPSLPLLFSASEDGQVLLWNSQTYRLEKTLNYGWERAWTIATRPDSHLIAVGYDDGTLIIKLGKELPAADMDPSGKIIFAKNHEVSMAQVRKESLDGAEDGGALSLMTKELGTVEMYPQSIYSSPNGRLCAVCGDGEFVVFTTVGWRNQAFGSALQFQWGKGKGQFVVKQASNKLAVYNDFKETIQFRPDVPADSIYGGPLIVVKGPEAVCFYDWEHGQFVKQIDIENCRSVFWSESGDQVVLATESSYFVLHHNAEAVRKFFLEGANPDEDGVPDSFGDNVIEIADKVRTGTWVGDCFIYTTSTNKLNYYVGGRIETIALLDKTMYVLGYLPRVARIVLMTKSFTIHSYRLRLQTINYQSAAIRGDWETADGLLSQIPEGERLSLARFLEDRGELQRALDISPDAEHRFELSVQLGNLANAVDILNAEEGDVDEGKWKQVADLALKRWDFPLTEKALWKASDYGSLLLLYTSTGDESGLARLLEATQKASIVNIALLCAINLKRLEDALAILLRAKRFPEAAFFARTYKPSQISRVVKLWRADLARTHAAIANALADPEEYPNLFPGFEEAIAKEKEMMGLRELPPATDYPSRVSGPLLQEETPHNRAEESEDAQTPPEGEIDGV